MHHDQMIMGVCGETRIANKRQSWVTAIQVFEYFISHHMAKAFESVFGGVSCLPGCFSMFRLKARKASGDDWVPLIIKPEIVKEYSQSEVTTLHQKNLLLLGEDRFLTTCLIRTFPNRKMMFLPQARCRTVVPDTFSVLLSQRRRWINSTIHNLMELVLVRNLCGTFCFSMQFVVFMDLLGTVVLPIAIALTYLLLVSVALSPPKTFPEAIPIVLLVGVLGLPAVLILITTRKVVYVFWMFIYLAALPIWNFILPVYAFWHFDDFSWGETRYDWETVQRTLSVLISLTEKSKAKAKGKVTARVRANFQQALFHYDDGRTGRDHGSARRDEKRDGDASLNVHTLQGTIRETRSYSASAPRSTARTMVRTLYL
jgi:chitin synthase